MAGGKIDGNEMKVDLVFPEVENREHSNKIARRGIKRGRGLGYGYGPRGGGGGHRGGGHRGGGGGRGFGGRDRYSNRAQSPPFRR